MGDIIWNILKEMIILATNNRNNILLKICGIRSLEEIEELKNLEIDFFGCIFAQSPRRVDINLAKNISDIAHFNNKKTVGVFVNESIENIVSIVEKTNIDRIQLHGNETPEYCNKLLKEVQKTNYGSDVKLWKVFSVKNQLPDMTSYLPYIEYPLFDTKGENKGGNGIIFDWNILKELKNQKFILAGGLSIENIAEALRYNPSILDVNSKVEVNDRKNKKIIEEVINIVKK